MIRTVFVHEFVTGGGLAGEPLPPSWAAEGRAMRRALAEDFAAIDGVRVRMTLDASLPDEPGPWEVVRVGPGEEPDAFARLAADSDWTLCVAPETGGALEERARTIERVGGRSLGSSPEAVSLCADKLRLAEHLLGQGIDTPPSIRVFPSRDGLPRDHAYPAVLKPIDGAGSIDTFYVESHDSSPGAMPEALLQPFVPGRAMSAAFVACPEVGPILIGLADQAIERVDGRFAYLGGIAPSPIGVDLGPLISAARSVPGLLGWVGVDFVWDEATGRLAVLEINPRATTSYVGFRAVESPPAWIARLWMSCQDPVEINWSHRVGAVAESGRSPSGWLGSSPQGAAPGWRGRNDPGAAPCGLDPSHPSANRPERNTAPHRVSAGSPVRFSADGRIAREVVL